MKGTCDVCGERRTVHKNRKTGKAICSNCYQMARYRDSSTHEKCFECGEVKPVVMRNETGKAICPNCYQMARYRDSSTHEKCFECGEVKPVQTRNETGKAICPNCYRMARYRDPSTHEKCFECGEVKPVVMRNETGKAICITCYQRSRVVGTTSTIITTGRFVVRDHFKQDTSSSAEVMICFLGDNFKSWLLPLVEDSAEAMRLSFHTLLKDSVDGPILQELGGEARVVTTAAVLWGLLKAQRNGEAGVLLTNSYTNIFYIRDASGLLRAVDVYWRGGGWHVDANSVADPLGWNTGDCVFSRCS